MSCSYFNTALNSKKSLQQVFQWFMFCNWEKSSLTSFFRFLVIRHSLENTTYMPLQQRATEVQNGVMKILTTLIHSDLTQGRQLWNTWIQGITHLWQETVHLSKRLYSIYVTGFINNHQNERTRCAYRPVGQRDTHRDMRAEAHTALWGSGNPRAARTRSRCRCTPTRGRSSVWTRAPPTHRWTLSGVTMKRNLVALYWWSCLFPVLGRLLWKCN